MNTITTIGRLVADPEVREVNGSNVTTFRLASTTNTRDRSADDPNAMITNFYRVTVWGKSGDAIMKYMKKGDEMAVSGELVIRHYKTQDGKDATSVEINATSTMFLRKKGSGSSDNSSDIQHTSNTPKATAPAAPAAASDDDLPF